MLKSEVERFHTQMQTLKAQLSNEQKQYSKLKASSGDLTKLEEQLTFQKDHNEKLAHKVQETHNQMVMQQNQVEGRLAKLLEEKELVEEENLNLCDEIKNKDEIIK